MLSRGFIEKPVVQELPIDGDDERGCIRAEAFCARCGVGHGGDPLVLVGWIKRRKLVAWSRPAKWPFLVRLSTDTCGIGPRSFSSKGRASSGSGHEHGADGFGDDFGLVDLDEVFAVCNDRVGAVG